MNSTHCLNCESEVAKAQNFCAHCGQTTKIHRFTLGHFFHEGFHAFTHADKGLFYLLKELTIRPGIVAREYISGKRKKYFNPFTFFLLLAAFFVLSNSFNKSDLNQTKPIPKELSYIKDPRQKEKAMAMFQRGNTAKVFIARHGNIIAMVAVPFFALYFYLIYYRKKYNYSEHLVANLMFVSLANLAFSLIVFPIQTFLNGNPIAAVIPLLGLIMQWIYFVIAYKGFMQLKGFWPMLKLTFGALIAIVIWSFLNFTLIAIYIYQNLHFYEFYQYLGR